jgi:hypothetical protein
VGVQGHGNGMATEGRRELDPGPRSGYAARSAEASS